MKSNRRILIGLLVILIVLMVAFAVQNGLRNQNIAQEQIDSRLENRIFPGLFVEDIGAIRLENPATGDAFTVARGQDNAWVAPGYSGAFDPEQGNLIAATLVLLPFYQRLENAADGDLSAYGFRPRGSLLIQIVLIDGSQHAVLVGNLTPTRDTYYAIVDEQADVITIERRAIDFLLVQLRDSTA